MIEKRFVVKDTKPQNKKRRKEKEKMDSRDSFRKRLVDLERPTSIAIADFWGKSFDKHQQQPHHHHILHTINRRIAISRRVTFRNSPEDTVNIEIPDEDEMKKRWFTQAELYMLRKDCVNTFKRLEVMERLKDDDSICARGLSIVDDTALKEREDLVKKIVHVVMEEQRKHAKMSENSNDEIAKMCHEISYKTTMDAIRIAKEDQKEAEEYLEATRDEINKTRHKWRPKKLQDLDLSSVLARFVKVGTIN